ncbi:hypothetical protein PIB30_111348, partial [Stylosanthes scabra]|nr:hypothetical protein [Stylosanthes scabra]
NSDEGICLAQLQLSSDFKTLIPQAQANDQKFQEMVRCIGKDKQKELRQDQEELWRYKNRICVPDEGR